jgi:hypothetical protein
MLAGDLAPDGKGTRKGKGQKRKREKRKGVRNYE